MRIELLLAVDAAALTAAGEMRRVFGLRVFDVRHLACICFITTNIVEEDVC